MITLTSLGKALADVTRVRILRALLESELCVCELVDALEITQSSLSTHLQTLRTTGIVRTEKRQSWIIYSIEPEAVDLLRAAFEKFPPEGARIQTDLDRLTGRIRLRIDGCCVRGIGALDDLKEATHVA